MNRNIILRLIFTLYTQFIFANPLSNLDVSGTVGGDVGNGGDELKQLFKFAQNYMARKIKYLNTCSFPVDSNEDVRNFIVQNRKELAAKITQAQHQWPMNTDQQFCGMVLPNDNVLRLSIKQCEKTTNTRNKVQRLLTHEAVHHLLNTQQYLDYDIEHFADLVAQLVDKSIYVPSCETNQDAPIHLLKGNSDLICHLYENKLNCKDLKGSLDLKSLFKRELVNPRDLSVSSNAICVLDDLGITCGSTSGTSFINHSAISNLYKPLRLWESGSSTCIHSFDGIDCFSFMDHESLNTYSDLQDIHFYSDDIVYLDLENIFVSTRRNGQIEETKRANFLSAPFELSGNIERICALDDHGAVCWNQSNTHLPTWKAKSVEGLDLPEQLVVSYRYACVLDRRQIKCWSLENIHLLTSSIPSQKLNIILEENDNSRIAFRKNNELCYSRGKNVRCIELGF